jgi:protein toll
MGVLDLVYVCIYVHVHTFFILFYRLLESTLASSRQHRSIMPLPPPFLLLLLLSPSFTYALGFDLTALMAALGGGAGSRTKSCPTFCNCSKVRAEDLMMRYVDDYLPDMGLKMNPKLKTEAHGTISFLTLWLGHMADISCHLPVGERANISDLLETSSLSFKALKVSCDPHTSLVWDLTHFNAFLNVLDISDCVLMTADGADSMPVPINMWVLQLDRVPPENAPLLDLSLATTLLAFSWTRSGLMTLPHHWSLTTLRSVLYINLAYNNLYTYNCQLKTTSLTSLNLNYNRLTDIPDCVLTDTRYTSHLSMRYNNINNLNKLALHLQGNANGTAMPVADNATETSLPTPQLFYLDLGHNVIEELPPLRKIQLLQGLDLSYNHIVRMDPETFTLHPYITYLDLSYNGLNEVPDGALINLVLLHYLNLSHNHLHAFSFDQSPLSSGVVDIDLTFNRLIYPPFDDTGYVAPRHSRVYAAHNPFVCDCTLNPFLRLVTAVNKSDTADWFGLGYWDSSDKSDMSTPQQPFLDSQEMICLAPYDLHGEPVLSLPYTKKCRLLRYCPRQCFCQLLREGGKRVVVDCSNNVNITELPAELPVVKDSELVLMLNHSGLKRLEHRPYLRYLTELHADHSMLSFMTSGAIEAMENITVLSLHNNLLRSLPSIMQNLSMAAVSNISLAGNPWTCGCHDLWLPRWLDDHALAVYDISNMRCRWTGDPVKELTGDNLNCGVFNYLPLVVALTIVLGVLVGVTSLLIKYRLEVLVFLYTRFNIRPFDMYRYNMDRPYVFDAFVSFSQHDHQWVAEELVAHLENQENPYKLCIHLRDFPAGAPIAESVAWAVTNARCTILVLTKHFLGSEWCRHEMRTAHARLLKDPQAKLIVIVHGPLDARTLDRELLAYLRTHTFLRSEDKWFWDKLDYALPNPIAHKQHCIVPGPPRATPNSSPAAARRADPRLQAAVHPNLEINTFLPAMAAGDVSPKRGSAGPSVINVPI